MDASKTTIVVGAPGCGKTTHLLKEVEQAIVSGINSRDIAFISFSKKAANEGKTRAMEKFGLTDEHFPHFKTIHALSFKYLGMRRAQMVGWKELKELGLKLGLEFKGKQVEEDDVYGMSSPDRMLFLEGLARNKMKPLNDVWSEAMEDAIDWWELERFASALKSFKRSRMLYDFNDLIERFCAIPIDQLPKLDLLIVDEVQDTSPLQWVAIERLAVNAKRVIVAGDDLQGIYGWSGADINRFIDLPGRQITLEQSWRIPATVHQFSEGIASRITKKRPRIFKPRDVQGKLNWVTELDEVDMSKDTWLLLARNGYMLDHLENWCLDQGFSFHSVNKDPLKSPALEAIRIWEKVRRGEDVSAEWMLEVAKFMTPNQITPYLVKKLKLEESSTMHNITDLVKNGLMTTAIWHESLVRISPRERDFFIAARKRGEPLLKAPRIKISTIHAAKGGEADHVLLMSDVSYRCFQNMDLDPDSEHRVWYVGATRCFQTLNIVLPRTNLSYEM